MTQAAEARAALAVHRERLDGILGDRVLLIPSASFGPRGSDLALVDLGAQLAG